MIRKDVVFRLYFLIFTFFLSSSDTTIVQWSLADKLTAVGFDASQIDTIIGRSQAPANRRSKIEEKVYCAKKKKEVFVYVCILLL